MKNTSLPRPIHRRAARAGGTSAAVLGAAALAGWVSGQPVLLGLRASYIPMAPNTAGAFIVLGAGLFLAASGARWGRNLAGTVAGLVGLVAALRLVEFVAGIDLGVDQLVLRVPAEKFGLAPKGKMSLPTSAAMLAASGALMALAAPSRRVASRHLAGAAGLATAMVGLVFSLGYLFSPNAPLLYGTQSIPMALNTSLGFVVLGVGLVAAAGPGSFPLQRLSGPSIRARLLRIFLPLVVATVGAVAWLTLLVATSVGASTAALSSAILAAAAILLFGVICERVAGRVGGELERAESELQQAHDLLEAQVETRTRELRSANEDLSRALGEIRTAHELLLRAHRELKETQSRMLQQAKMASLGQTAAGVAHEINNPLAFVTNNLVILKREVAGLHDILLLYQQAEHTLAEYQRDLYAKISDLAEQVDLPFILKNLDGLLERSRTGLLRIQKIVSGLRDFAHLEEADFKEVDLNDGVITTVRLMQSLADQRQVTLETDLGDLPRTVCFPAKINLVVQSLISNAIDASRVGGRVVIQTRAVGDGTEIRVSDRGSGIDPAIRERIFDPFFTTKPVGQGTGLGLSMSYGIVKDHGGTIDVEATVDQGARFTVRLPPAPPGEPVRQPQPDGPACSRGPLSAS